MMHRCLNCFWHRGSWVIVPQEEIHEVIWNFPNRAIRYHICIGKKLTWISGYATILTLRTKDSKLYVIRKQMKCKKTNFWKVEEKADHNWLREALFTSAFSNRSKDFTCRKAWLITGHQHWHLQALSVWQYHKFWKKIQFPEKQSFSMGN